jgi:disulfide bond formation protein DsbB
MYPQIILFCIVLWKKNGILPIYNSLVLSIIGAIIAGYHYLLQLGVTPELPCAAVGYSIACSQRFVMNFGYITIPLMAFSAFVLIVLFMVARKLYNKKYESI